MFQGQLVRLRPLTRRDLPQVVQWSADDEFRSYLNFHRPLSLEEEDMWFNGLLTDQSRQVFAIETLLDGRYIGNVGLEGINHRYSLATAGIFIGDRDYWGKGYGSDAMRLLLGFAFNQLNLNRVQLDVFAYNERAIHAYEKCGFVREGVRRQAIYKNGEYSDVVMMAILREDFRRAAMPEGEA